MLTADPIVLGPQTGFFDQPYVEIEMFDEARGLGPYGSAFGFGIYPYNRFLLDTGANSILSAAEATLDLASRAYQTEGTFRELGIAGFTEFDVSAPYRFDFVGTDGQTHTLSQSEDDVRILSSEEVYLAGSLADGGIAGIVGMPAMAGRVTTLDMSSWADTADLFDLQPIGVTFSDALPPGEGVRYSVAVDDRVWFDPEDGRPPGAPDDSPLPVWAPVPFMTARPAFHGNTAEGDFLLDTGAQMSIISEELAFAIGLDEDGDGNFNNELLYTIPIGGIGGTIEAPVLLIDELRIPTQQDVDLAWLGTDPDELGLEVLVLNIHPEIDGILGVDLLTAGLTLEFDPGTFEFFAGGAAYFDQVHFDFRGMMDGSGTVYFDLHPYRAEIQQSGGSTRLIEGVLFDTYQVVLRTQPADDVTIVPGNVDGQLTAVDDAQRTNDFLVFTSENWSTPQTVRVAAVDDGVPEGLTNSAITHTASSADPDYDGIRIAMVEVAILDAPAEVVARHVFYNESAFDGNGPAADARDDGAIAPDKEALLPGQTAGFANYTSYRRGLGGIMVDLAGLPAGTTLEAADFRFRVGNDNDPNGWATAPAPRSITVRPGDGVGGADRVTILWDDHAIEKTWLEVTVLPTNHTWLAEPDVFYFGNAVGETGNSTADARVNAFDMLGARDNQRNFLDPAPIDFDFDFNRDARADAVDMLIARNHQTHFLNDLELITVPADSGEAAALDRPAAHDAVLREVSDRVRKGGEVSFGKPAWVVEFEPPGANRESDEKDKADGWAVGQGLP